MAIQNSANNQFFTLPWGCINLTGVKHININKNHTTSGTFDLYTCPTGKRCWIPGGTSLTISSFAPITHKIKVSGTYYPLYSYQANTTVSPSNVYGIVLEAGETYSITTTGALNLWLVGIEFDNICPFKTAKILALSNGDNTLYTVPANTNAFFADFNGYYTGIPDNLKIYNNTASTATYTNYLIKSGQTKAARYNTSTGSINTLTFDHFATQGGANAGDFVLVNTNITGAQTAWINLIESPA